MPNPYKTSKMSRRKRKHKLRYRIALVLLLPQFLLWKLGCLLARVIPESFGRRWRRFWVFVTRPFRNIIQFTQTWFKTRAWRKLWVAAPVVIVVIFLISTIYIAQNQADEDKHTEYLRGGYAAMGAKDYKLASFLFGKLLAQPQHRDDTRLMYQAMVAASLNNNQLRVQHLLSRLTGELNFGPAYMWKASRYLSSSPTDRNIEMAIQNVEQALKVSAEEGKDQIREQLASLYVRAGQNRQAIKYLNSVKSPSPRTLVMLLRCYQMSDLPDQAEKVATQIFERLDVEDPDNEEFLLQRVDALSILASASGTHQQKSDWLMQAVNLLEERLVITPDDPSLKEKLGTTYLGASVLWLKGGDTSSRSKAFEYFDHAISTGYPPQNAGKILLTMGNLAIGGAVTLDEIKSSLVNGEGVLTCHLLLGLNAWNKGESQSASLHFRLAHALEPQSLKVLKLAAVAFASNSGGASSGFALSGGASWKQSIKLLSMLPEIDPSMVTESLDGQCTILATLHRWFDIPPLLEPQLNQIPKNKRSHFFRWLAITYKNLDDQKAMMKYEALFENASKQQNAE